MLAFLTIAVLLAPGMRSSPALAADAVATAKITGTVITQENGLPISGASVTLDRGDSVIATTTTDADGAYVFDSEPAGEYGIVFRATGYEGARIASVVAGPGSTSTIRTVLARSDISSSQTLREIGSVKSSLRGDTLAATSTIQHDLNPAQIQAQGFLKAADAFGQVPGVNITGGPHSVGDDTFIDIRGMGQGEVRPLIDGHPIGPIGVLNQDYYDYANSPYQLFDNLQVTLGSGASGLYGVDVIGGTIDLQTLNPTVKPHAEFDQTFGNQGTASSVVKATGTLGRFGFAVGHTVTGTYADFAPQQLFQGARPNNDQNLRNGGACLPVNGVPDLTSCNTRLNTYFASGNYKVLSDLVKLRYSFLPGTSLTLTGYAGNHLTDNTGNGDDDYVPFDTRLAQVRSQPQTCSGGYLAVTDSNPNACLTATQLANQSYGGLGGGADRNRGTTLQDFNARFDTQLGINSISLDAYRDFYQYRKNSNEASGFDPTGKFYIGGGTYADDYLTNGFLISDDIASPSNDVGFGYFVEHQREYGNNIAYDPTANVVSFVDQPTLGEGDYSFFLRDNYTPNKYFGAYANAWSRRSSVTNKTTFDPRLSLVFRPTSRDVARLTGGRADGDPGVNVAVAAALSGFNNPSSLNPQCNPNLLNSVASSGNGSLKPEGATDFEAAYGHRFWSDTSINVVGYVSSVKDQLFPGVFPITPFALANPSIAGSLAGFASKINATCGTNYTASTVSQRLGLSGVFNASSALFRGLEFSGRVRVTPDFSLDYGYDIQSSQQFGEPVSILVNNPFVLDGGQIISIPVHKGSLTFDYANNRRGFEAQIEGYYVGDNNTLNRPAYTFFNGFVSKSFGGGLKATLSASNLFDQNSLDYGYFGHQLPNNENQYQAPFNSPISQTLTAGFGTPDELFGLSPRLITFSLSERI